MALQTSGQISLNDIHVEAGGSSGTSVGINDTDVRDLTGVGSGGSSSFSSFYGTSSAIVFDGPVTIATHPDLTAYYSFGGNGYMGYFNNLHANWHLPSGAAQIGVYPYGQLGTAPNTHTPTGHLIRGLGKFQGYPDKGDGAIRFHLTLSGHIPDDNTSFTSITINKNAGGGGGQTFYRSSAEINPSLSHAQYRHSYAFTSPGAVANLIEMSGPRNTSDPVTRWSWLIQNNVNSSVFLNTYVASLGWSANGQVKYVEII